MKKYLKKFLSILLLLCVVSSALMISTPVEAASSAVESAIAWAIATANDNSHGYSQSSRWGPDYDCSSFVISAFRNAGIDTGTATYTGNMRSQFTQHGFQWIPWSQIGGTYNLQRGDILLNEATHTEIYLGNNQNVGAHSNRGYPQTGDQTGTEVSVSGYYNHPWDGVLRYTASSPCTCSTDYAGNYYVSTNSLPLTMRSGHGTGYSTVISIPKGSQVYVSRSDGSWAHVEWNGYSGYCSMAYLTKVNEQAKSYQLHVWVSDTKMGDVPSKYTLGNRYYICYELIDKTTGKKANETSNINYNATETIRNSGGVVFEHTYEKSDYNWISIVCNTEDTYTGTVTISGDLSISCTVSFDVYAETRPQIKAWVWEGDDSNEVSSVSVGKTAYCSYLIRDKYTEKNLNDVTTIWTSGNGYEVTVHVYAPDGSLVKTKSYKNADCSWIDFIPNKIGDYKIVTKVSGNLTGTYEKTFTSIETEHSFSSWSIVKKPTCTTEGTSKRTCSFCGKTETQTKAATGHNFGSWTVTKKPTCTTEGTNTRTCVFCNTKETSTIAATGHKYTDKVVKPTTSEKGYTLHTCTVCNYSYKDNYTNTIENSKKPVFQFNTSDITAKPNSTFTVDLALDNNPGITSFNLKIAYPADALALTNIEYKTLFTTSATGSNNMASPFTISWFSTKSQDEYNNGVIVTLTFKVKENIKKGAYPITLSYDQDNIFNASFTNIPFEIKNVTVNIKNSIPGDTNGDGKVNMKDIVLLQQHLNGWNVTIDKQAANVNGDSSINMKDIVLLQQYLNGWNVELK